MAKKKVIVSFDYENDKDYKNILLAWNANPYIDFTFNDITPSEINSFNIDRIKAVLTQKIKEASYTLVIVGKYANQKHKDSKLIDDINWINWEINKSKELGKKLVGVKIDKSYESPIALLNSGVSWALSFTKEAIIKALNEV